MYENVYNIYMNKIVIYHGSPRVVEKPIKSANKRFEQIQREERYSRGTRLRDLVLGEN